MPPFQHPVEYFSRCGSGYLLFHDEVKAFGAFVSGNLVPAKVHGDGGRGDGA